MWRHLLEFTDSTGRVMVGCAFASLVIAVLSFVAGIIRAVVAGADGTLNYWLATMGFAFLGGLLIFLASRRTDVPPR